MNYAEMNYNICPSCKERGIPRGENGQVFACQVCQVIVGYFEITTYEENGTKFKKELTLKIVNQKVENTSYNKHQQLQTFLDSLNEDELGFVTGYAHTKLEKIKK